MNPKYLTLNLRKAIVSLENHSRYHEGFSMGVFFLTTGNIGKTPGILQDAYELENPKKKKNVPH